MEMKLDHEGNPKQITLEEFQKLAAKNDFLDRVMTEAQIAYRIKSFWTSLSKRAENGQKQKCSLYASDVKGSLFSKDLEVWNIDRFKPKESLIHKMKEDDWMEGIHRSYLYIGTRDSLFSFHVEDWNLNSISFLHCGAPKVWYAVAEKDGAAFEELCKQGLQDYVACDQPMRHKTVFINRKLLHHAEFNVTEIIRKPDQIVITWGGAYHGGFNTGFNVAEASNFASEEWREVGLKYADCKFNVADVLKLRGPRENKYKPRKKFVKYKAQECYYCKKMFGRPSNLRHHIKYVHEPTETYECVWCSIKMSYRRKGDLVKHIQKTHMTN